MNRSLDESFVVDAVARCLQRPSVAAADVYVKESRYRRILRGPAGERSGDASEAGLAVRLFRSDGRVGHAYAASADDLDAMTDAANRLADRCSPDAARLPPGGWDVPDLDLVDPAVEIPEPVSGWLSRLERAVTEEGRDEVSLGSILCVAGTSRVTMATSGGFRGSFRSSLVTAVVELRAARGAASFFDRSVIAARHLASLDADRLGRRAAARARLPLDGGSMAAGPVRVALDPRVACILLEHLSPSLVESAARRGRSALPSDEPGTVVGPSTLTLVDDPSLPRGIGSAPFDGEGLPTKRRRLVEAGRLGPLLGSATGRRGDRIGAAHRTSYSDPPRRLPSNLHVERGERGPRAILGGAGEVLRVTGATLLGRGGPASGEVVLAASGELLRDGEPAGGIRGVTLVGRLSDLLHGIREAGNDLTFHLRGVSFGSPTLLVDGFTVV